MDAKQIAQEIVEWADKALDGQISMEEHGEHNKRLWDLARETGVGDEVGAILQAISLKEMEEAIAAMGG